MLLYFILFPVLFIWGLACRKTTKLLERHGSVKVVNVHLHVKVVTQSIYLAVILLLVNIPALPCLAFSTTLRNRLNLWAECYYVINTYRYYFQVLQ